MQRPLPLRSLLTAAAAAGLAANPTPQDIDTAPYEELDRVEGSFVNLANFPVRPMALDAQGRVWAVNHHDGRVRGFEVTGGGRPFADWPVPWDPVSIATWENDTDPEDVRDELVVVCAGSWTVVRIDALTGDMVGVVQLRQSGDFGNDGLGRMAEPADVLVDPATDEAFVSCPGADSVIRIDLATSQVLKVYRDDGGAYDFRCKRPLFLSWDKSDAQSWKVLVAPLHSGNDTAARTSNPGPSGFTGPQSTLQRVIDLSVEAPPGLPDEDLFRIDPVADTVTPVLVRTGALLFAHGTNPDTGDFWQLTVNADNARAGTQNEEVFRGTFMDNQVQIVQTPFTTPSFQTPIDLDFTATTGEVVGQPFQLTFVEQDPTHFGKAFLTGVLTDNVTVLNPDGTHYKTWPIVSPAGRTIPRQTLLWSSPGFVENVALVYCWGTNEILAYRWDNSPNPTAQVSYDLGFDPTPPAVARGREIFYDGSRSLSGDLSCASCHVEGGRDMLAWNLSAAAQDDKGPMATQTLVGIDRLEPFHWRGERAVLKDFNGAFIGLLGDDEVLTDPEFDDFQAFVFSLRNGANPNQNRRRLVDESIAFDARTIGADAVEGQSAFRDDQQPLFNDSFSCQECHQMPTGTGNDVNPDAPRSPRVSRSRLTPTPFNGIFEKQQALLQVTVTGQNPRNIPLLGVGTSHGGVVEDLLAFTSAVNGTPADVAEDITNFIHQWDQGLAPAVHYAYLLHAGNVNTDSVAELSTYLHAQAVAGNCDIAVIGRTEHPLTGALVRMRWAWNRHSTAIPGFQGAFVPEAVIPGLAVRSIDDFRSGALADGEHHVFLGLPKGMAEPFAIDHDMDGFRNGDPLETAPEDPAVPGTGGASTPVFVVAPTVPWKTTKVARILFETNEATTAEVRYRELGSTGPWRIAESPVLAKSHAVVLTGMRPSTNTASSGQPPPGASSIGVDAELVTYEVEVEVFDNESPSQSDTASLQLTTDPFIEPDPGANPPHCPDHGALCSYENGHRIRNEEHVIDELEMQPPLSLGNIVFFEVDARVVYKRGPRSDAVDPNVPGAPHRIVIGRPLMRICDPLDPNDCTTTVIPEADWTAGTGSIKVLGDVVAINPTGSDARALNNGGPEFQGAYVVTRVPTDAAGRTDVRFDVTNVPSGARVIFDVDAVLEIWDPAQYAQALADVDGGLTVDLVVEAEIGGSWEGWSFPDNGEESSFEISDPLP